MSRYNTSNLDGHNLRMARSFDALGVNEHKNIKKNPLYSNSNNSNNSKSDYSAVNPEENAVSITNSNYLGSPENYTSGNPEHPFGFYSVTGNQEGNNTSGQYGFSNTGSVKSRTSRTSGRLSNTYVNIDYMAIDEKTSGNFSSLSESGKQITIVSDTEGFNPTSQIEKIMKAEKLIYLGDLLDYTTNYNTNIVEPTNIAKENLCALKLLQHFNDNPDVKSVLGNREFNKVKFWPLLQITDFKGLIDWWTDKDNNNILDIAMKLCVELKPCYEKSEYKWMENNLQAFCPFWRYNQNINQDFKAKFEERWGIKNSNDGQVIPKSLYERYEYLFGADPPNDKPVGTIGAQNTHICLPRELGYTDEDLKNIISQHIGSNISIDELRAAIVFTVYARMLDISLYKKTSDKKHGINYSKDNTNELHLDGVLANYLINTPCVGYTDSSKGFYLFAHGGVSLDFIQNDVVSLFDKINKVFKKNNYNLCKNRETSQAGGNKLTIDALTEKINKFNAEVSTLMSALLKTTSFSYQDYLETLGVLTTLSVPDSDILKETDYKAKMSPIVSGLPINNDLLSEVDLYSEEKKIYTFFGHIPNGCGYGFYKIKNNQYSITTDFSASLFSSNIIFGKDKSAVKTYNNNNLLLKLDTQNGELKLEGNIHIKINDNFKQFPTHITKGELTKLFDKDYKAGKIDPNNNDIVSGVKLFHTKKLNDYTSLRINFNDNSSIQDQLDEFNKRGSKNPNIVFHGNAIVTIDNHAPFKAEIFSVKNGFHKELVINNIESIKEGVLKRFARKTQKLFQRKPEPFNNVHTTYTRAGENPVNALVTTGGSRLRSRKSKLRRNKLKLKTRKIRKIHINKRRNSSRA